MDAVLTVPSSAFLILSNIGFKFVDIVLPKISILSTSTPLSPRESNNTSLISSNTPGLSNASSFIPQMLFM